LETRTLWISPHDVYTNSQNNRDFTGPEYLKNKHTKTSINDESGNMRGSGAGEERRGGRGKRDRRCLQRHQIKYFSYIFSLLSSPPLSFPLFSPSLIGKYCMLALMMR
jgi:hypothetical protein